MKTCSKCREYKNDMDFSKNKSIKSGLTSQCKDCASKEGYRYRSQPEVKLRRIKQREKYNKLDSTILKYRERHLMKTYGITINDYDKLLLLQDNKCAICGEKNKSNRHYHVDHCHKSGVIRGILCHSCNVGIGNFREDHNIFVKAVEYLGKYK